MSVPAKLHHFWRWCWEHDDGTRVCRDCGAPNLPMYQKEEVCPKKDRRVGGTGDRRTQTGDRK